MFSTQPSLVKKVGRETRPREGGRGWYREVPKGVTVIAHFVVVIIKGCQWCGLTTGGFSDGDGDVNSVHNNCYAFFIVFRTVVTSVEDMSSISAQGVVERASAELSKRINGLGLRSSKHHRSNSSTAATSNVGDAGGHGGGGKTSVMERVTNVFCGGSNSNNVASCGGGVGAPEKPSRLLSGRSSKAASSAVNGNSVLVTPQVTRRISGSAVNQSTATTASANVSLPHYLTWEQLILDERFLSKFFLYFTAGERRTLAQVCGKWRDVLYRTPRYWAGLIPVLRCRELRAAPCPERARLYSSLLRRGFHAVSLLGATDEDALDLVHSFPLAAKHVHSLSLRCSSVSDRGLEALLDHLQACVNSLFDSC